MRKPWNLISRRTAAAGALLILVIAASQGRAAAQATATGALTVLANVTGSIQLQFSQASNGVTLTGNTVSGSAASATLNFGSINPYTGTTTANVTFTASSGLCSNCFSVSTPLSLVVNVADSASAGFALTAYATITGSHGEVLSLDGSNPLATTSASATSLLTSGTGKYGTTYTYPVYLAMPTSSAGAGSYSDTITFTATAS